jgi:hypothetical protein
MRASCPRQSFPTRPARGFSTASTDLDSNDDISPSLTFDRSRSGSSVEWLGIVSILRPNPKGTVSAATFQSYAGASTSDDGASAFVSASDGDLRAGAGVNRFFSLSPRTQVTFFAHGHVQIDDDTVIISEVLLDVPGQADGLTQLTVPQCFVLPAGTCVESVGSQDRELHVSFSNPAPTMQTGVVDYLAFTRRWVAPIPEPSICTVLLVGVGFCYVSSLKHKNAAQQRPPSERIGRGPHQGEGVEHNNR